MSTALMVVIAIVVIAVLAGAGFLARTQARTRRLRRRFGPEYDRAVERHGGRTAAERELMAREQRHQELRLRELDPRRREMYRQQWTHVQEQFVDTPEAAVEQADRLVTEVMGERGYPTRDFDEKVAHLSVEHGRTLDHYRRGHAISTRAAGKQASTEELRQAMVHYRALFEDLLAVPDAERHTAGSHVPDPRAAQPHTSDHHTADHHAADHHAVKPQATEPQATAPQATERHTAGRGGGQAPRR